MEDKLLWLTTNRQDLVEANRGKWVVIDSEHNKVFAGVDPHRLVKKFKAEHPHDLPSLFKIPTEEELDLYYGTPLEIVN